MTERLCSSASALMFLCRIGRLSRLLRLHYTRGLTNVIGPEVANDDLWVEWPIAQCPGL